MTRAVVVDVVFFKLLIAFSPNVICTVCSFSSPSLALSPRSVDGGVLHPLLLLPLVAEPHADDVLLQVELLRNGGDLLAGRPRLHREVRLEGALLGRRNGGALSLLIQRGQHADVQRRLAGDTVLARLRLGRLQPRLENGLQGDHVVVGQCQRLEAETMEGEKRVLRFAKLTLPPAKECSLTGKWYSVRVSRRRAV